MKTNEQLIEKMILDWTRAISTGDRKGILKSHSKDILMYDFPDAVQGIEAYDKTWDFFFAEKVSEIRFEPRDIQVTASDTVAFASCLIRCEGTSAGVVELRLTTGFKKINGDWIFVHEHHSVPTTDERLIEDSKSLNEVTKGG